MNLPENSSNEPNEGFILSLGSDFSLKPHQPIGAGGIEHVETHKDPSECTAKEAQIKADAELAAQKEQEYTDYINITDKNESEGLTKSG